MNIRSTALERGKNRRVYQPDDRRNIIVRRQLFNGDILVGIFLAGENIERQTFAGLIEDTLRLLVLLEQIGDLAQRGHAHHNARAQQPGNLVDDHQLRRIGNCNGEPALALFQRHEVVAEHHVHGHGLEELDLDFEVSEIDKFGMVAASKQLRPLNL